MPERFVGRTGVMAQASAVLAPRSGASGVVLHGMPGGGKTACAVELGYTHEDAFRVLAWFRAPDDGQETADALSQFALALERAVPGLELVHLLDDPGALGGLLPSLTALMERNRILVAVDNAESLLTASGQWRDARWEAADRGPDWARGRRRAGGDVAAGSSGLGRPGQSGRRGRAVTG